MFKKLKADKKRHDSGRKGAALVEAALVLPVFFLVIMGVVEFGRALTVSQLVTNAAREGARRSVLDGATNTDVETYVRDILSDPLHITNTDVIAVTITITPATGNTTTGDNLADAQMDDQIKVEVSVPYNEVALAAGHWMNGKNISGESTMRRE
ncbi:MAG: pilus assembly protein [Planctomycetaceae bacterium]|nr:pilus assembly protein [Planctomycetaceae bacterium]MCB9950866.1 pilus assembly protein [Planctomycetaceae bacterium]